MLTKNQIKHIINRYRIKLDCYIIKDDVIDVDGDVVITNTALRKLPLKFGKVNGDFICSSNRLQSLIGAPSYVGGHFNCYGNELTSLKYAPLEVGGDFSCHENLLVSLNGIPKFINGNFNAFLNQLSNLKYGPERVNKSCYLFKNKLASLDGSPLYVGGSFHVTANNLDNLVGCPEFIGNIFSFGSEIRSLYMGNHNCQVKKVIVEIEEKKDNTKITNHTIALANQQYLPIIFKYMTYFSDIFFSDGTVDISCFEEVISDIKSGLR